MPMLKGLKSRVSRFERISTRVGLTTVVGLLLVVAWLDFLTGWPTDLTLVYLLPVGMGSWLGGTPAALGLAGVAALLSIGVDLLAGNPRSHLLGWAWSTAHSFSIFAIFGYLSTVLRRGLVRREGLALIDPLTELPNSRGFYEQADRAVKTAVRYSRPITIAYIGVDHFDFLNARFGHRAGDDVLISIARTLRQQLRETDLVARLAGDEFGVVLPEAGIEAGRTAVEKARETLLEATEGWSISFSIGAVTCDRTDCGLDELVRRAESAMRQVKEEGRNAVRIEEF